MRKALMEIEYIEIDGLLYPNIEFDGADKLAQLGKYGLLRLNYLHEHKPEMYRELFFAGKLAEYCESIDKAAFERSERIRAAYLKIHPMPEEDALQRIQISTQAQNIANEIILAEIIYT